MILRSDTTTQDEAEPNGARGIAAPSVMALVVAWCSQEPSRLGEVVIVPLGTPGESRVLGRGAASASDDLPRLDFARHRPGKVKLSPPLGINSISRSQLVVRALGPELLEVNNIGRAELLHNGALASQCV